MCKSIRATHETKQVPTDAAEGLEKETTVEPPESDHPKCEDLVVANGRWSLTRIEPRARGGVLPYMGYIGMCRCEGYVFRAVYSRIGYLNQNGWV